MTTVTITGTLGPDVDVTSLVIENVKSIKFEYTSDGIKSGVIEIAYVVNEDVKIQYFDLSTVSTVTYTISGADTAIVIS